MGDRRVGWEGCVGEEDCGVCVWVVGDESGCGEYGCEVVGWDLGGWYVWGDFFIYRELCVVRVERWWRGW